MVDVFKNMTLHNIFHCIFSGINTSKYFLIVLPKHDWTRVWGHAFSGVKTSLILQGEHTPDSLAHTWLYTLSSFSPTTLKYLTLPQLLMSILTCVAAYCCQVLLIFLWNHVVLRIILLLLYSFYHTGRLDIPEKSQFQWPPESGWASSGIWGQSWPTGQGEYMVYI